MSLFGGIMEGLFGVGGDPQIPEVEWDELAKLMKLGIQENRFNQNGLFTSNTWDDDKGTMTTSVNPQIQGGMDALLGRVNQGTPSYPGAGRFEALLNSMQFGQQPPRRERPPPRERPVIERPTGFPTEYRSFSSGN